MAKCKEKCVTVGLITLIALFLLSSISIINYGTITGAVAGESYIFEQCLKKYGKDIYGKWMWDEIKKCRDEVDQMAKGKDKATPRLYLTEDRSEFQNE